MVCSIFRYDQWKQLTEQPRQGLNYHLKTQVRTYDAGNSDSWTKYIITKVQCMCYSSSFLSSDMFLMFIRPWRYDCSHTTHVLVLTNHVLAICDAIDDGASIAFLWLASFGLICGNCQTQAVTFLLKKSTDSC